MSESRVLRVGAGRGFVVECGHHRLVVTAAHCLPHLPPAHPASYLDERTYGNLLGLLGEEPDVWAECLFADPVADVAVLGEPDDQELSEECEAYEALTESLTPLKIADRTEATAVLVLSLDGRWFGCTVRVTARGLVVTDAAEPIAGGMSGSPILAEDGHALGVVSTGEGFNPRLAASLPGWFLRG